MAEFIFKKMAADAGLQEHFLAASCATSTEEIWNGKGNPVYPPAAAELAVHGISCTGKTAVQLKASDYGKYDFLICMDAMNIRNALKILGGDPDRKMFRLMDFTSSGGDVADPWYTGDFALTYRYITLGCTGLMKHLTEKGFLS